MMNQSSVTLDDFKQYISAVEDELPYALFKEIAYFERNNRLLHLCLTERLCQQARKRRIWKSKPFLTALKNAQYGFDEHYAWSSGGRDGIFLLDRSYDPPNEMMAKIFGRFLDKPGSDASAIADEFGATLQDLMAVRLVSHHMRLLGVLWRDKSDDWLILVDYDTSK